MSSPTCVTLENHPEYAVHMKIGAPTKPKKFVDNYTVLSDVVRVNKLI